MKLSVIIPTYNRADILHLCLQKLMTQEGVDFEVIVVDDGSTDNTADLVLEFIARNSASAGHEGKIKYIHQKNAHQGAARNRGAKEAMGDILLFIGDDILVEPGFLLQHLDAHLLEPEEGVVVLGYTTWAPTLEINSYMKFLEASGWQFAYHLLKPGFVDHLEPYKFFYTSNISLKKSLFDKEQFNETFREYGWEDIELGYRFWKKYGMRLYYEPDAMAFHHHLIPEESIEKRMRAVGRSAVKFESIQPDVKVIPRGFKAILLKILTHPIILPFSHLFGRNMFYKFKSWQQFLAGVEEAKN